jgi:peptidoglycan/LPS O-acetylase OafA/YrhL
MGRQVLYGSLVRIPIFLIGYWMGWFLYEKKEEEKASWMVHVALLLTGIILAYYIHTYVKNPTIFWGLNCYPALCVAQTAVEGCEKLIFGAEGKNA